MSVLQALDEAKVRAIEHLEHKAEVVLTQLRVTGSVTSRTCMTHVEAQRLRLCTKLDLKQRRVLLLRPSQQLGHLRRQP